RRRPHLAAADGHAPGQGVPADQRADPRRQGRRARPGQPRRAGRGAARPGAAGGRQARRAASAGRAEHQARAQHAHQASGGGRAGVRAERGVRLLRHPRAPGAGPRVPRAVARPGRGRRTVVVTGPATTGRPDGAEHKARPFVTDLDAYRAALRAYLTSEPSLNRWRDRHYDSVEERIADHAVLMGGLYRGRWNRYGWPEEAGGLGGDPRHRAVLYDELSAAGLPVPDPHLVLETLGPAVLRFAPELAAEHLPAFLRGEEWWGQGFSEPEAGSDLAALRCRARRDGDRYVLSGQKLWTSHGATATRLVCLVRTGTPESRHRGLSMIMVDAAAPGVTIRPVALASGDNELAEVFFDDVEVPASRLVGAEGQGWAVAMYLLQ